jgi:Cu/Zn superoxide dismutase
VPSTSAVKVDVTVKEVTLEGGRTALLDTDGAALVVHESADDYKSDPAGNSGTSGLRRDPPVKRKASATGL